MDGQNLIEIARVQILFLNALLLFLEKDDFFSMIK